MELTLFLKFIHKSNNNIITSFILNETNLKVKRVIFFPRHFQQRKVINEIFKSADALEKRML